MNKELKKKLYENLNNEFETILKSEDTKKQKDEKMFDMLHLLQIIENFEELEPVIQKYMNEKADRERFDR